MSTEGDPSSPDDDPALPAAGRIGRVWRRFMAMCGRFGIHYRFTTISGRILTLNLLSLLVLVIGLLYLNDFRGSLIDARIKSLETQALMIARSVSQMDNDIGDPLLDIQKKTAEEDPQARPFSISPELAAQILHRLIEPTRTHGYIYNQDGTVLVDSNTVYTQTGFVGFQQPVQNPEPSFPYKVWLKVERFLRGENLPMFKPNDPLDGKTFPEVKAALEQGNTAQMVRVNELGETILTIAVPVHRDGPVLGALLLMTVGGEIDGILAKERLSIIRLWTLVLAVTVVFALLLGGTIVGPIHRLAVAAETVRKNIKKREEIPDFTHRSDEIGNLSTALREMTMALYKRMDAIESFAADVAHELKNPLFSLRGAADMLNRVKNEEDHERLVQIIQHDVARLNRLITDISDASRLDAELARERRRPVNVARLLDALCTVVNDIHREGVPKIELQIAGTPRNVAISSKTLFVVKGHESRLAQVVNNLIDNAISFSPPGGRIFVTCRHIRKPNEVEIAVEDEGPGIPAENLDLIFDRFYTDRPDSFGQNSGLGLHISRQIITAHGGRIWAENRYAAPTKNAKDTPGNTTMPILGASFIIRIPALL
jgi:two-component system, OmpR family, sensor histidine kinase ChvG